MNDGFNSTDDSFNAEEEAAWTAMASGEAVSEPANADLPATGGEAAAAPVPAPTGNPQAPGEVVDPEAEEGGADENKGKFVRHGAFHQERERRKAVERERDEFRVQMARMEERLRIASEGAQAQAPAAQAPQAPAQPATPPDPNEDIFGAYAHLQAELAALKAGQTQLTEAQKAEQAQRAEAAQRNEVLTGYRSDVQRVMAARPEFADAYEHLFSSRIQELKLLGVPEADAVQAVREEEFGIAQAAIQAGQSPAERLMQIAQIRGFAPKAAAPAAPVAPAETPAEKTARIAKGQAASLSLSSAGGAPAGELTLEMLASMSEADFAKMEKANPARVRALMGG
ncbi:hypothetical protein [Methylobacterium gossipiicola]|uniref:Scaffolding protein n=1 Tax=Methylobacterium gossipiicola TaxID=582675 RepID=A0A1I2TJL0_9HYPH|nr:hypothetical protein [Methylobacterium gossipiicola]SFG65068.1 hypothetical protein SAMN05192565_107156 [Methylobacterium gossipiicola]